MTRQVANGRDGTRVEVTRSAYETLVDAADTYREVLVIRLCGEVGVRPSELVRLTPACVRSVRDDPPRYLLAVPAQGEGDDSSLGSDDVAVERHAYLPTDVERELRRYVRSNDIHPDDAIFSVSPRRLQMLVSTVGDRANDRVDDPTLGSISTDDLRRFFARSALLDLDVNPRVVKAVGGWRSFAALEPYLAAPDADEIVSAFDDVESRSGSTSGPGGAATDARDPVPGPDERRAAIDGILDATTHQRVETNVCSALVDGDAYEAAWIERSISGDRPEDWRTVHGIPAERADLLEDIVASADAQGAERASPDGQRGGRVTVVRDVSVGDVDGFTGDVASISIAHAETTYGTMRVGASRRNAFDDEERRSLETLGRLAGYAITAIRRRSLLLADSVVELEFVCRDDRSLLVDLSARLGCRFELISLVQRSPSTHLFFLTLEGASPADVFDCAMDRDGVEDCRLLETTADGWRVEFVVTGASPALTLSEYGTTVTDAVVDDGVETITAECAVDADLRTIVDGLRSAFPDSALRGKRTVDRSVQTADDYRRGIDDRLTDRQEAALRAAYFGGYYDWPRESTAEEIADSMGVSSPTLHNHLRKGQHELLRTFFERSSPVE